VYLQGGGVSDRAPYSRVYWSVMEDPKFDGIREDPRLFGSWSLLLIAADMAHPSPAYLLPTVTRASVTRLVEAGLIDLLDGHRYRIHGLDAERERRRALATTRGPSGHRPVPGREANGHQAKQSKAEQETRQAVTDWDDGRTDLEAFLLVTRRAPTEKQRQLLDNILDRRDVSGPQWSADIILRNPTDPIGALIEADKAWRAERIEQAKSAEAPKAAPRRPRGLPESTQDILRQMRELDAIRDGAA
jgi:hypothetical protein